MEVMINGAPREVPEQLSLEHAVSLISTSATGIAVAVNGEVVRRASWPEHRLLPGDEIEVLTAVQGG
ncbi:MAG TPA: sulfur carrier protein ThiS [Streptosporangiaceae bacterium]|nr:sulfur carrier protein ThiS [Streptosporangiaceae bacterium]